MDKEEKLFQKIAEKLSGEMRTIGLGKMMSSPGIKYKGKVFVFYYKKQMVFRLGKDFNPKFFKVKKYSLLNPFKNKPPLAGWFQIPSSEQKKWETLARQALYHMIQERKN